MEQTMRHCEKGYSMVEAMMVVVIAVISAAIAIPITANTIANSQLRGSASSFASLAQQARLAAIQKNTTYTVRFGLPSGNGAYVDLNGDSNYTTGEPLTQFGGDVEDSSAPSSSPTKLDASGGPLGWTATAGDAVTFNSRGLPCNHLVSPCATNVNYVFYFTDTRAFGAHGWAAVSITAAGRTKAWWWNGSSWID